MEIKEGLKVIRGMCQNHACINCPFMSGSKCYFEIRTPNMWEVDIIEQCVKDLEIKEYPVPADNEKAKKQPCDMVNHPAHYTQGGIECIDAIKAAVTGLTGIEAVCTGNVIRYIWRWKFKNGLEDLKKCRWYIDKLIEEVEGAK